MARTLERPDVPAQESVGDVAADPIPPGPPTPLPVRVAASGVLVGGMAIGAALARTRVGGRISVAVAAATGAWTCRLVAGALRAIAPRHSMPPRSVADGTSLPFVTVLVAARDEEVTLPRLLVDLARQDHVGVEGPLYEVVVVDDRSTDGTTDVIRRAANGTPHADRPCGPVRLVTRSGCGIADGKGAALRSVPAWLSRGDLLLVLDADARVDPGFVRRAAELSVVGHPVVTARRRMLGTDSSALAQAQDDEQTADLLLQIGRRSAGGSAELRGNGVVVAREALRLVGGWSADALTEDLELSTRLALMGVPIEPSIELVVHEAPVAGITALWTQRVRWAEGSVRRYLAFAPAIARVPALPLRCRLDLAAYGLQLAIPGILAGALLGGVRARRYRSPIVLGGSYAGTAAAVSAIAIATLEPGGRPRLDRLFVRAIRTALFSGLWLLVVPVALLRVALVGGELRYRKTTHRRIDC